MNAHDLLSTEALLLVLDVLLISGLVALHGWRPAAARRRAPVLRGRH